MTSQVSNENDSDISGRLEKLERENRKLKRFGAVLLIAVSALFLMGQTGKSRSLDADSLVIRDGNGNVRIELGTLENQSSVLKMYTAGDSKDPSVVLVSSEKGAGLSLFGKGTFPSTMLSNYVDGGPSLLLVDFTGATSIGVASVHTYDQDKFSAFMGRTSTVNPKSGATTQTSAASLILFGKDGKVTWSAP